MLGPVVEIRASRDELYGGASIRMRGCVLVACILEMIGAWG